MKLFNKEGIPKEENPTEYWIFDTVKITLGYDKALLVSGAQGWFVGIEYPGIKFNLGCWTTRTAGLNAIENFVKIMKGTNFCG